MPRARSPDSIEAEKLYKSGMALVDIAKKLGKPEGTVRRWKSTQKWDENGKKKQGERSQKKNTTDDEAKIKNLHKMVQLARDLKEAQLKTLSSIGLGKMDSVVINSLVNTSNSLSELIEKGKEIDIKSDEAVSQIEDITTKSIIAIGDGTGGILDSSSAYPIS